MSNLNMSRIPEWEAKKRKALIAICTLGLSEAPWKLLWSSSRDADKGMSFEGGGAGFIFRIIFFIACTILTSAIIWIVNIFKFINYSVSISMNK